VFWLIAALLIILALAIYRSRPIPPPVEYQTLISLASQEYGVPSALMQAIIKVESDWVTAAWNPQGLSDPRQGSFGLGQICHTNVWSWPRHFQAPGDWPGDLYKPEVNIPMMARILSYFLDRGFGLGTIDIYNLGEYRWSKGERNLDYRAKVQRYYAYYGGAA